MKSTFENKALNFLLNVTQTQLCYIYSNKVTCM